MFAKYTHGFILKKHNSLIMLKKQKTEVIIIPNNTADFTTEKSLHYLRETKLC